jgi:hypothetical protein
MRSGLGSTDPLGVAFTVGDLLLLLARLGRDFSIVSGRNNEVGIALHHHAFVDPQNDYVSFTQINTLRSMISCSRPEVLLKTSRTTVQ